MSSAEDFVPVAPISSSPSGSNSSPFSELHFLRANGPFIFACLSLELHFELFSQMWMVEVNAVRAPNTLFSPSMASVTLRVGSCALGSSECRMLGAGSLDNLCSGDQSPALPAAGDYPEVDHTLQ